MKTLMMLFVLLGVTTAGYATPHAIASEDMSSDVEYISSSAN